MSLAKVVYLVHLVKLSAIILNRIVKELFSFLEIIDIYVNNEKQYSMTCENGHFVNEE